MPLYFFYTMVEKSQKMTKNSNQGGPALIFTKGLSYGLSKSKKWGKIITKLWKITTKSQGKNKKIQGRFVDLPFFSRSAKTVSVYRN